MARDSAEYFVIKTTGISLATGKETCKGIAKLQNKHFRRIEDIARRIKRLQNGYLDVCPGEINQDEDEANLRLIDKQGKEVGYIGISLEELAIRQKYKIFPS